MLYMPTAPAERGLLLEPGNITADSYQIGVVNQIQFDGEPPNEADPGKIRGIPAPAYLFMGVQEELLETIEIDANHPPYNRAHRLLLPTEDAYAHTSPDAELYHAKEFGDLSWYVTAALSLQGLRLASALIPSHDDVPIGEIDGFAKWQASETEWQHSGFVYLGAASAFVDSFDRILRLDGSALNPDGRYYLRQNMAVAASELLVSMSVVLQSKLNTNLATVLSDNNAKITRRIRENTIFGEGGDKR